MESNENNPNKGVIRMNTKVQKWGNSLAIRIPSDVAKRIHVKQGSEIEITVEGITATLKSKNQKPTLKDLVNQITPENQHREVDSGSVGKELL
ncbi:AbrB/MazE/SpoVT family DNA-binding domain-containing protein [Paraliobacillus sediminis]|uniref:AbrB/MazE/SpoVT family DNA-binding domain-containing protein n=1 Tax=Paraliobacillus sediminis TaxID=1885916 RepID=UPI000E3B9EDD|nr:AbrB/MazE/SpoVT family DNA-binding domain-containing protein [Paraliobacillus sediminis]